ncbi:MAG TPA: hypothetical protein VF765_30420 [Polyangiaceae bacterium]
MRGRLYIAIALVSAPLLAASCGGETGDAQARQPSAYPTTTRPDNAQLGPPSQNMPGGGRGSEPPHFKGKP